MDIYPRRKHCNTSRCDVILSYERDKCKQYELGINPHESTLSKSAPTYGISGACGRVIADLRLQKSVNFGR